MRPEVRHKGLEPSLLSKLDPKSSASTNSANAAEIDCKGTTKNAHMQEKLQKLSNERNFLS